MHDTITSSTTGRAENLRHRLKPGESFEALANRSILQSFARSVNTSLTVIMTLLAMMILGEPSTRLLVVALMIGIISGTYSSIFNATSILVDWEMWLGKRGQSVTQSSSAEPAAGSWPADPVTPSRPAVTAPTADSSVRRRTSAGAPPVRPADGGEAAVLVSGPLYRLAGSASPLSGRTGDLGLHGNDDALRRKKK